MNNGTFDPIAFKYSQLDIQGGTVQFTDVLKDICTQVDSKILLMATFILTFFVLNIIVLPRAFIGLKAFLEGAGYDWLFNDYIKPLYDRAVSILETFALGSSIGLIVIFYYQQGLSIGYIITYSILGGFVALTAIATIIGWVRSKFNKNV